MTDMEQLGVPEPRRRQGRSIEELLTQHREATIAKIKAQMKAQAIGEQMAEAQTRIDRLDALLQETERQLAEAVVAAERGEREAQIIQRVF